jgi:hypothetical protein
LPASTPLIQLQEEFRVYLRQKRALARPKTRSTSRSTLPTPERLSGVFCISPQKGSFQSYGCKTYRKKKSFCTYVLQQQKWRTSGLSPAVA